MAKRLPPQADGPKTNDERAEWAQEAIDAFRAETGTEEGDVLCDLLADLAHWADRNGFNFADELRRSRYHYREETMDKSGKVKGRQFDGVFVRIEAEVDNDYQPTNYFDGKTGKVTKTL